MPSDPPTPPASAGRRKSSLNILRRASTFAPLSPAPDASDRKTLKKKGRFSSVLRSNTASPDPDSNKSRDDLIRTYSYDLTADSRSGSGSASPSTLPSLSRRVTKPPSLFGNLKSFKGVEVDTPPATATSASSRAPSFTWKEFGSTTDLTDIGKSRSVLHYGEAQTASNLFWKKKEYLVLTETHLVRFKNQTKAMEVFRSLQNTSGRGVPLRHVSTNSVDSAQESQSFDNSEVSGEKAAGVALEDIVAVYLPEDARHASAVEFSYLDNETGHGSSIMLTFNDLEERDVWLRALRTAANKARLQNSDPIPSTLAEYVARAVEYEHDYDVMNFKMYKIVKRVAPKSNHKSSSDESMKSASVVCFLVIGAYKVHLVHLPKTNLRVSASTLAEAREGGSFGILTLTRISVNPTDDAFSLEFRLPLQRATSFPLASLAASDIALELRQRDGILRPEWIHKPFIFNVPLDDEINPDQKPLSADENSFDRTLLAFCVAYNVNPASIRYTIHDDVDDGPRFELLEPSAVHGRKYSALQLLAVMRSLRFDESFGSVCFAKTRLDVLNGLHDRHGVESVCTKSRHGTPLRLKLEEQYKANLLVQEVRALAMGNKRLRRMDFSYSIVETSSDAATYTSASQSGCGIVEALYPLCRQQMTNVDWLYLNGIQLCELDLEYLIGIAADRSCHIRAIEASRCGLTDRGVLLLLDALRAQSNTLEAIDLSNNILRLVASNLSRQLDAFGFICKLDLSNLAVTTAPEPLLPLELLCLWRLQELRLSGIALNSRTVEDICGYLAHPQSEVLRELDLSSCSLTGKDIGLLMEFMTIEIGTARLLHLDISGNPLQERYGKLVTAIARNVAPTHLSIRAIELDNEDIFREILEAVAKNKSIRYLDLAKASLPAGASEGTCKALEKVFAENQTLEDFDISGEDARLEVSRLGKGINIALNGLKYNQTLEILRIRNQRLGLQGASKLAYILKENTTLRQLHCEDNDITLTGFTDLVNAMATNTTLLHLPTLEEGRESALKQTELQIKGAKIKPDDIHGNPTSRLASMRRSLASRGNTKFTHSKVGAVPDWSAADVQAALRLVNESWQRQIDRLQEFLERNWKISMGMPVERNADAEEPHRPGTASSMSKLLERVRIDSTPTVEKQVELGVEPVREEDEEPLLSAREREGEVLANLAFDPGPRFEDSFTWGASVRASSAPATPAAETEAAHEENGKAGSDGSSSTAVSSGMGSGRSASNKSPVNRDKELPPTPPPLEEMESARARRDID